MHQLGVVWYIEYFIMAGFLSLVSFSKSVQPVSYSKKCAILEDWEETSVGIYDFWIVYSLGISEKAFYWLKELKSLSFVCFGRWWGVVVLDLWIYRARGFSLTGNTVE